MSDDHTRPLVTRLLAASPYAMTMQDALAHIHERRAALLTGPPPAPASERDFAAAEPMPVLDQPAQFAAEFWRTRKLPSTDDEPPRPKLKLKRPKGRRPTLGPRHGKFEVFDGGAGVDNEEH